MTLQQLEYIVALDRYGNFAKAAFACDVTQPTLSAMIQKLEAELGLKIFDRRRQPVVVTRDGRAVIAQAREVLHQAQRLRQIVDEETESLHSTFVIGVLPTITPYLIPHFFPQLMNAHPEMDVRIVEMKTATMKKALVEGEIDAGIASRVDGLDNYDCHELYSERFMAYVAQGDPLEAKERIKTSDLTGAYLWLLDEGHCFRDQLVKLCSLKAATQSKKAYSLGSIETFMRIVENGKGVTFIPELALAQLNDYQRSLVHRFAMPEPRREIVMITMPHFLRHKLLKIIVDRIRACVAPLLLAK